AAPWRRHAQRIYPDRPRRRMAEGGLRSLHCPCARICLDRLKSARAQRERYIGPWLPEPLLTAGDHGWPASGGPEARLDTNESVSMALLVLLESLTPIERAVFLLREVFDFGYDEIAGMAGRREDACRQIFCRAKQHVSTRERRFAC